jgi:hypothetical protein
MKLLWSSSLSTNTVHVDDVAKALWHLKDNGDDGAIFNLCDEGNTSRYFLGFCLCSIHVKAADTLHCCVFSGSLSGLCGGACYLLCFLFIKHFPLFPVHQALSVIDLVLTTQYSSGSGSIGVCDCASFPLHRPGRH